MNALFKWLTNFDLVKACFLAIVAVVSSWYDLRSTVQDASKDVETIKALQAQQWVNQNRTDKAQDEAIQQLHEDIRSGFDGLNRRLDSKR